MASPLAHLVSHHRNFRAWSRHSQVPLVAWALALACPRASHAAQPLDLSWEAPPGCPQESTVRERIRSLVPTAMLESGGLKAEGTVTRIDQRFRLKLVLRLGDVHGERIIDSDSCSDLAGAAAVALGLLLRSATQTTDFAAGGAPGATPEATPPAESGPAEESSSAVAPAEPAKPEPAKPEPAVPEKNPAPSTEQAPKTPRGPRSWRAFLAPELSADMGPLPMPDIGLVAAAGMSVPNWLFAASFALPRRQHLTLAGPSGAGANLAHASLEAWMCRPWRAQRFELAPCAIIGLETLLATGTGSDVSSQSQRTYWVSVGAAALGRLYLTDWLAIAASVGAKVEGARPIIRIDGLADSQRLGFAALTLRTGPMVIF
jgi:hypothetical protein